MSKLIVISGISGAGKSTAARFLEDAGYMWFDFADVPKDAAALMFALDRNMLEGEVDREKRDQPDPRWSELLGRPFTPRDAIIETAERMKALYAPIWAQAVVEKVRGEFALGNDVVIGDCRSLVEIEAIRAAFPGYLHLYIEGPPVESLAQFEEFVRDTVPIRDSASALIGYGHEMFTDKHRADIETVIIKYVYPVKIVKNNQSSHIEEYYDKISAAVGDRIVLRDASDHIPREDSDLESDSESDEGFSQALCDDGVPLVVRAFYLFMFYTALASLLTPYIERCGL
jgi:hypothetical protein